MMFSNMFPIEIPFDKYVINRVPYTEESLRSLREKHNKTHSFFPNGSYIYISNKTGDDLNIGEQYEYDVMKEPTITASIMRHIFFKTFLERFHNRVPLEFHPFRFMSTRDSDDWLLNDLPDNLKNRLGYKKVIEVQIQHLEIDGSTKFYFVVNIERNWVFNIHCSELMSLNFSPIGYDVVHSEIIPGLENILAPNEEFVGKLTEINVDLGKVESATGSIDLHLNELFLKKSSYNIRHFLSAVLGEQKTERILSKVKATRKENTKHKTQWAEIRKVADSFTFTIAKLADEKIVYSNKDGFSFTIAAPPFTPTNSLELKKPTFIFDKSGVKTNNISPDLGLSNYGPYDSNVFHAKTPQILSICHKTNRGRFTSFLQNLFNGLPESKYFKKGFKGKFELHDIVNNVEDISAYSIEEYKRILGQINTKKPDLIVLEIDDNIKVNDPTLYYKIKSLMLMREIPVQVVLKSRLDDFNEFILNSIALQLYAKLGGVPWVLKSSMSVDRELVIGIGHSIVRKSSIAGAEQDRVVGITTFFSSDGQYLLSNKAKDVPYEQYFQELLGTLKDSFTVLQSANNWKDGDTIRLIFHIFKPIKNVEFDVVGDLIKSFPNFKIQFAFVTIGKHHPYLLFDDQGGKSAYKNGREYKVGEYVPFRGANLKIGKHTCLVQMLGGKEVKSDFQGASNPLLIKIRIPSGEEIYRDIEPLLFVDIQYIVQQIFSFTYLSWRNYLPSEHPATMLYSQLIAKQLGRLRKIDGWSPDILNYSLKTKKWFL